MNLHQLLTAYRSAESTFNASPHERGWILQDMRNIEDEIIRVIIQPTNPYQFGDVYDLGDTKVFVDADNENRLIIVEVTTHVLPIKGELNTPKPVTHFRDEQCTLKKCQTCVHCGAYHGTPCQECAGRAYHRPNCSAPF